ncbi:hypothetical protein LOK49_LG10G00595 [Camellia lanceoleosa]|uniref:Uncharacterized protein n=1 Tax=Camellia lanceoleosa TaxID=1840588 RepID=A0ACC0GBJ0_9ERIC|nr:hypothetical protein LOK49_LG10G00595 [Camellia lanceoleosa]
MASMKAAKPVGTQLFGQVKKEPASAKTSDGASKTSSASKAAPKKVAIRLLNLRGRQWVRNQQLSFEKWAF